MRRPTRQTLYEDQYQSICHTLYHKSLWVELFEESMVLIGIVPFGSEISFKSL